MHRGFIAQQWDHTCVIANALGAKIKNPFRERPKPKDMSTGEVHAIAKALRRRNERRRKA